MSDDIRIQSTITALEYLKANDSDSRMARKKRRQTSSKPKDAASSGGDHEDAQEHKLDIQI